MADILVIHHEPHMRELLLDYVRRSHHTPIAAADLETARGQVEASACRVVLVPAYEGGRAAAAVVAAVKAHWQAAQVIVIGANADLAAATEAVRHGAHDYVVAATVPAKLGCVLQEALRHRTLSDETVTPQATLAATDDVILGSATRDVFALADRAATVDSTVLITGESGTGKEVLARYIHRSGAQRLGKFVPVNCGSLPESLIETELFGYKKGAFTGAATDTKGLIEEAEGGILFLDEIGDMPLPMQVRLLRFLDSGEIRAVGDTAVKHIGVRVIAATNRCLRSEIREKRFREDLFFRLSVISLHLPPLRERRGDLAALVQYYTGRTALKLQVPVPVVSDEAMALLVGYDWPGNIRELQNALEQAIIQDGSGVITPRELRPALVRAAQGAAQGGGQMLITALQKHNGNRTETAAALGMSRTTLWRKLRQLNVPANLTP